MKSKHLTNALLVVFAAIVGFLFYGSTPAVAQGTDPDAEVLTRGPIHEAFAEPADYNPTQGVAISSAPPATIEEIPPDEKPVGDAIWIPGYWQWDEDFNDFIWVSGIWRVPPPGCSWVPGYYTASGNGWVWVSGFWMSVEADEVEYLPPAPQSLEIGPSSRAPSPNYLWTPGCWIWVNSHYAWRPGYWVEVRPDWVWVPARYVWTPRGCVYVDGYWDRPLVRRGVIFAPVRFSHVVYSRPRYVYSPSIVIQIDFLTVSLFISPHRHYCFGDYYDVRYTYRGYRPWFHRDRRHRYFDHNYAHERWMRHREDSHWESNLREDYKYRVDHPAARPARTYSSQDRVVERAPERQRQALRVAAPITEVAGRKEAPIRFEKIDREQRQSFGNQGRELVKYRDERAGWETHAKPVGSDGRPQTVPIDSSARRSGGETPDKPDNTRREQPSRESAQPSRERAQPSREPVQPSREPAQPSRERTQPSREPVQPPRESAQPSRRQEEPLKEQVQPRREPVQPVGERAQPSKEPAKPSREPVQTDPRRTTAIERPASSEPQTTGQRQRIEKSPIYGKPAGPEGTAGSPPRRPEPPKPDLNKRSVDIRQENERPERSATPASTDNKEETGKSRRGR